MPNLPTLIAVSDCQVSVDLSLTCSIAPHAVFLFFMEIERQIGKESWTAGGGGGSVGGGGGSVGGGGGRGKLELTKESLIAYSIRLVRTIPFNYTEQKTIRTCGGFSPVKSEQLDLGGRVYVTYPN